MQDSPRRLIQVPAGLMEYERCWRLQQRLHAQIVAADPASEKEPAAYFIFVEHPPVLTFGKHADRRHLLFAQTMLREQGVQIVDTDRGGEVTAHEPGQLVVYPILKLVSSNFGPKSYVSYLEQAVIRTLSRFGIEAATDPEHPGVWVGRQKVCAIGVRIKDRATLHGLALNVTNSLTLFQKIVPCGIAGRGVTTMSRLVDEPMSIDRVAPVLMEELARGLGADMEKIEIRPHLATES